MATDEALLDTVRDSDLAILRVYDWDRPAVSLGYFQPAALGDDTAMAWVRRPTGGGLVRHDQDLTFTLVAPLSHPLAKVDRFESYRLINAAVAGALLAAGLADVHLHPDDIPKSVDRELLVCFTTPAKHDVVGPRGKVAGGAQRRTARGILHQGSIDLRLYPEVNREALAATALRDAFAGLLGQSSTPYEAQHSFQDAVEVLVRDKYATDTWNRKR